MLLTSEQATRHASGRRGLNGRYWEVTKGECEWQTDAQRHTVAPDQVQASIRARNQMCLGKKLSKK